MKLTRLPILLIGLAVLPGCATLAPGSTGAGKAASQNDWPARVGTASVGAVIDLPPANELGEPAVRVGEPYTAASGRRCRRMVGAQERTLSRLVCSDDERGWYLTRSLSVLLNSEEPVLAAALPGASNIDAGQRQKTAVPSTADGQAAVHELADGETLWSFAARVTGDPLNWQIIATHNGIGSSTAVPAGARLAVPADLLEAGE